MQHHIATEELGPRAEHMTGPIEACVHCGFCLPTCPTYVTLGEEMDSPRGRIFLMKEVLEGQVELEVAQPYLDNCLGCVACVSACPSGVQYGDLITAFRAHAEPQRHRPAGEVLQRELTLATLPHPRRFRLAARSGRLAKPFAPMLPAALSSMLRLLPDRLPRQRRLPEIWPAVGTRRARVALLAGCAQQVLAPEINWATLRVLAANGVETIIPRGQACCGALAMHTGEADRAQRTAVKNLTAFPRDIDAVLTNAAGCGSGMHEYGLLFAGTPEQARAQELAGQVQDISVFLDQLGWVAPPPALPRPTRVAYHDACHLAHAQGVRGAPRRLLAAIENLELVEPAEWELCCGSAGTYNVERPELAAQLGRRKRDNLLATGAELIATGNIGCMTQLATHLREGDAELPVLHTIELIDRAYRRELTAS
ncbi:MAG TPA: glycolate oxidase subunit GlcF [Solirubrobacteraceae bacterium]|nr:glycolate oxidase subunit GlcF [Solirubrobacteraceae bacterium]